MCTTESNWPGVRYLIVGVEVAPETGRAHLQGYLQCEKRRKFGVVQGWFQELGLKFHLEQQRSRANTLARDYCMKDGCFFEWGTFVKVGERTDLNEIVSEISEQKFPTVRSLAQAHPEAFVRYHNGLTKVLGHFDVHRGWRPLPRIYYWSGVSGSGKTKGMVHFLQTATEFKESEEWFWARNDVTDEHGRVQWWDGYDGEPVVIWDDFKGNYPIKDLLCILDQQPFRVQTKGSWVTLKAYVFCFTSNSDPKDWYYQDFQYEALMRRFRQFSSGRCMPGRVPRLGDGLYVDVGAHQRWLVTEVDKYCAKLSEEDVVM